MARPRKNIEKIEEIDLETTTLESESLPEQTETVTTEGISLEPAGYVPEIKDEPVCPSPRYTEDDLMTAVKLIIKDRKQPTLMRFTANHSNLTRHALFYALESTIVPVWEIFKQVRGNHPREFIEFLLDNGFSEGYDVFSVVGYISLL